MVDPSIIVVRSYSIAPDARGAPRLSIMTDRQRRAFSGARLLSTFITAAYAAGSREFRVRIVIRETPTGGKYEEFEVVS